MHTAPLRPAAPPDRGADAPIATAGPHEPQADGRRGPAEQQLTALVLRLAVHPPRRFDIAGASAQALVLALIGRADPSLATALRRHQAARPYTVAVLAEETTPAQIAIRVTAVGARVPAAILCAVQAADSASPLSLGPAAVIPVAVAERAAEMPWAGGGSLWELQRRAAGLGDTLTLELASPLLPRHRPDAWRHGPPPRAVLEPPMLFDALRERWLALGEHAPQPDAAAVAAAAAQVDVLDARLRVVGHLRRRGAGGAAETLGGFVGRVTLRLGGDPAARALLRTLAAAAFYLGAGVGTASGMGRARLLPCAAGAECTQIAQVHGR